MMKIACVQMTTTADPARNAALMSDAAQQAATSGAGFVAFPETCNFMVRGAAAMQAQVCQVADDIVVKAMVAQARALNIWISLGSVIVLPDTQNPKSPTKPPIKPVNRSLLLNPQGQIIAHYDKIHMFDAVLEKDGKTAESHTESDHYQAGTQAVLAAMPPFQIGLTICYDVRFPALYHALGAAGADIIIVPSAFTRPTGQAHWQVLLRARAIETGCYIIAAAQCGTHENGRKTYGHSLICDPWGHILAQAAATPTIIMAELHADAVRDARRQIPALKHSRPFTLPFTPPLL